MSIVLKKTALFALVLGALIVSGVALADGLECTPPASPLPGSATDVWQLDGCTWGTVKKDSDFTARAFTTGDKNEGYCNRKDWIIDIKNEASIGQWIKYSFNKTGWNWQVRKPGIYAADGITFTLKSNGDVNMKRENFGDLVNKENSQYKIPTFYAIADSAKTVSQVTFVAAASFNTPSNTPEVYKFEDISTEKKYKLWNKLEITDATHKCEYSGGGKITLSVSELKPWLNDEGNYK